MWGVLVPPDLKANGNTADVEVGFLDVVANQRSSHTRNWFSLSRVLISLIGVETRSVHDLSRTFGYTIWISTEQIEFETMRLEFLGAMLVLDRIQESFPARFPK